MEKASGGRAGRLVGGLAAVLGSAVLLLVPSGSSSRHSELPLQPYLPRSPHHAYGYALAQDGFRESPARDWLLASEQAVAEPVATELPLQAAGRFESGSAAALGWRFGTPGGRRIVIEVTARSAGPTRGGNVAASGAQPLRNVTVATRGAESPAGAIFVDLFSASAAGREHLRSAPPVRNRGLEGRQRIELAVVDAARYLLRVQPSLEFDGEYAVSVTTAPLLTFPVDGADPRAIKSGFGAERDGGARAHRGVDIFAPRGTPVVAAMDSWVARVDTTPRGGNVVWLQPLFGNMRLYYAHLDTQLVASGEFVLAGDVLGTVGNTGNARTTPPHLHFGVYVRQRGRRGGARDPYPFLD